MKRTRVHAGLAYGVIATTLLAVSVPALASTVVVPNANTSLEGDDGNSLPFGWPFGQVRYQQVYAASQFPAGLLTITAMTFRPDQFGGSAFSDTADVTIKFSTTSNGADGLSVTFSDNLGPDVTTVFSGVASISSSFTGTGPQDFDVNFPFTTPFTYDPSMGNLLMGGSTFHSEQLPWPGRSLGRGGRNLEAPRP